MTAAWNWGEERKAKLQNFINGEFVDPKEAQYIDNFHPASGKVYGKVNCQKESPCRRSCFFDHFLFYYYSRFLILIQMILMMPFVLLEPHFHRGLLLKHQLALAFCIESLI
jgi:hypothetical protein